MKILLVVPKYTYNNFETKPNYHYIFPIGLGYISAILKKKKFDYDCYNLNHEYGTIEEMMKRKLGGKKYDIVCTGDMALGYPVIEKIVNSTREYLPDAKIIVGGAIITSEPELMAKNLNFDFGVIGEGEETIVELLKSLENNEDQKKVKGLCWKEKTGEIVFTGQRDAIKNLDSLPFPDYEGLEFEKYLDNMSSTDALFGIIDYPRMYPLFASRGCPYQCTFCYHSLGPIYRFRTVDNIIKEINYAIKKFKINSIFIMDDLFAFNKERIYDFCKRMKKIINEDSKDIKWACQLAVNSIDKELLKTMKESGCVWISFGFESYSPTVLKSMRKPITQEQIKNAIQWCLELQIGIEGGFIFGDSAETKDTAKETLDFWKKEGHGQLGLFFIQPYPGSVMYERAVKKGIIRDKMEFIKNGISRTNFFNMTDSMNDKDFKKLIKDVLKNRAKYCKYVVSSKIIKEAEDKYSVTAKCPYCKDVTEHKNCYIRNPSYYSMYTICTKCMKRFYIVSRMYKFTADYYFELDFLRKGYLFLRKKMINKKI
jgi:anaerobic magnesium-protoporphyrin IX monomethyl ester cyclase